MGCASSKKLSSKEDDVVSLCRERKSLIKLALERRYALAEAHCKYNESLYAVALSLRLFVARHSSPSSPFLITFPSTTATTTTTENPAKQEGKEEEEYSDEEEPLCEHFYDDVSAPPLSSSPRRNYQWDFFNLFDVSTYEDRGLASESNKAARTRDIEGGTKLEPCGSRTFSDNNSAAIDGRELLEALKDVEDHFVKAYNSGKAVSRMLESNRIPLHSGLDDIKGGF